MNALRAAAAAALLASASAPALAQRTDENAVADADDAFGRSIGGEQIGIYSPDNVRGFSPVVAGNVRIEGLYFDQQSFVTDRTIEGRTVHVGISAQGYPFPAPTGIADYDLRAPGAEALASVAVNYGPYGGVNVEVDAQLPILGERLGMTAGYGHVRSVYDWGGDANTEVYGASLRFQPAPGVSLHPFLGLIRSGDEESRPFIFTSGDFLPPKIDRPEFFGQHWTDFDADLLNYGAVGRGRVAGFDLAAGLFRSEFNLDQDHFDLHFDTDQSGHVGSRIVVAEGDNKFGSTSGELRASRTFADGPRRHSLHLSARGRALDRRYGGAALIDLGESEIGVEDFRDRPDTEIGPKSRDKVRQKTFGAGYELRWKDLGEFSVGLQKVDYRKSVATPDGPLPTTTDKPWLWSATAAAYLTSALAIYGGYTRGLEESDVAPSNAVNRNEAPPAIRTKQHDIGFRYAISPSLSLVAGYFNVEKPYFNLDADSRFRQLGTVTNRGFETSLAGRIAKGLTVNAGAIWLDATLSGEEVDAGLIGRRPIGNFKLRTLANVQWQVPWHEPLTLTARFESTSDRVANTANTFVIPARSVTSLGARYRRNFGKVPMLVRATVDNIFDKFGWGVTGGGAFVPNGPRRFSLSIAADL